MVGDAAAEKAGGSLANAPAPAPAAVAPKPVPPKPKGRGKPSHLVERVVAANKRANERGAADSNDGSAFSTPRESPTGDSPNGGSSSNEVPALARGSSSTDGDNGHSNAAATAISCPACRGQHRAHTCGKGLAARGSNSHHSTMTSFAAIRARSPPPPLPDERPPSLAASAREEKRKKIAQEEAAMRRTRPWRWPP